MRALILLAFAGLLLAFAPPAFADASTGTWVKFGTTETTNRVGSGQAVVFAFPSGTSNSALLSVTAKDADVCFDDDTAGSGGTGRATLKLALTTAGSDNAAITVPALYTTNLDCRPIVSGKYWVQIDTAATASENPIVVVFGR